MPRALGRIAAVSFILLAVALAALAGQPANSLAADQGRWSVETRISPMDDSKNVILSLPSDNWIKDKSGKKIPILILRCKEKATQAYIVFDLYLGDRPIKLLIRMDKEKAYQETWNLSTNHLAAFAPDGQRFIKELLKHQKLLVQVAPEGQNPVIVTFQLRGLPEAVKPLRESCGW